MNKPGQGKWNIQYKVYSISAASSHTWSSAQDMYVKGLGYITKDQWLIHFGIELSFKALWHFHEWKKKLNPLNINHIMPDHIYTVSIQFP